jgi:hypothetical protein
MHRLSKLLRPLLSVLALAISVPAAAQMRMIELSHEAEPSQLVLPTSSGASLVLRPCPGCAPRTLRTDANTAYQVGDEALNLASFAVFLRSNPRANLTVMTNMRGDYVTRVKVQGRSPANKR